MLFVPHADLLESPHHRHQAGGAIDHRDVDHLALARRLRFEDSAHEAERHEHAAATEVADEVDRRGGFALGATEVRERAGQRDVVDVVARGLRHRAVLAPTRHPPVDELRIACEADVGAEAEALGDTRPEPLEQCVGAVDELQHELDALGVLQVDADRAPPAIQRLEIHLVELRGVDLLRAVDADDVGAHVRQQHSRERSRSDTGELDDLDSCKRSHAVQATRGGPMPADPRCSRVARAAPPIRSAPLPLPSSRVARAAPPIRSAPLPLPSSRVARAAPPIRSAPLPLPSSRVARAAPPSGRLRCRSRCASHPVGSAAAPSNSASVRGGATGSTRGDPCRST